MDSTTANLMWMSRLVANVQKFIDAELLAQTLNRNQNQNHNQNQPGVGNNTLPQYDGSRGRQQKSQKRPFKDIGEHNYSLPPQQSQTPPLPSPPSNCVNYESFLLGNNQPNPDHNNNTANNNFAIVKKQRKEQKKILN